MRSGTAVEFAVLASGSAGNCSLLRVRSAEGTRTLLVDLGLGPRALRDRLRRVGASLSEASDILVTHLDGDHVATGWERIVAGRPDIRILAAPDHAATLRSRAPGARIEAVDETTWLGPGISVRRFGVPHDEGETSAWRLDGDSFRLGYATDLGRVTDRLLEEFRSVDALLIESNYDPLMQAQSRRPAALKRRITGGRGHLSNGEALEAVLAIAAESGLRAVALLHLSRQCNDPRLVRELWRRRAAPLEPRLVIASQHAPTGLVRIDESLPRVRVEPPCRIPGLFEAALHGAAG